jgi:hypothetical protein
MPLENDRRDERAASVRLVAPVESGRQREDSDTKPENDGKGRRGVCGRGTFPAHIHRFDLRNPAPTTQWQDFGLTFSAGTGTSRSSATANRSPRAKAPLPWVGRVRRAIPLLAGIYRARHLLHAPVLAQHVGALVRRRLAPGVLRRAVVGAAAAQLATMPRSSEAKGPRWPLHLLCAYMGGRRGQPSAPAKV